MKKLIVLLAVVVMAGPALAFHPGSDCDRCHIPHATSEDTNGEQLIPLWSGVAYEGTDFVNYDSPTMDADTEDPQGATLVCLACHDNSYGDRHDINPGVMEGDLSGTHPMEFVYDSALADLDKELVQPDEAGSSTVVNGYGTITKDLLSGLQKVNCQSCHEIHVNGLHETSITASGQAQTTDPDTGDPLVDADGEPIMEDVTVSFDFDIPHLVNIPGITFRTGYRADPVLEDSYSLSYGVLCTTCHIK